MPAKVGFLERLKSLFGSIGASRSAQVSSQNLRVYWCDLCGPVRKSVSRNLVFDHLKKVHPDVIDRNRHICEEAEFKD